MVKTIKNEARKYVDKKPEARDENGREKIGNHDNDEWR